MKNKPLQTLKYILFDAISAATAWVSEENAVWALNTCVKNCFLHMCEKFV